MSGMWRFECSIYKELFLIFVSLSLSLVQTLECPRLSLFSPIHYGPVNLPLEVEED